MCHGLFFLRSQPHEYGTEKILRASLSAGGTFVDVGANVGYYSVLASSLVGPAGTVLAVEPQPAALSLLRLNANAQHLHICVVPVAASDHVGVADFWVRPDGDLSSLRTGGIGTKISVRVDTLDRICAGLSAVSLLKIDVEGFELDVLRGATQVISRHRPMICFELLDESVASGQVRIGDLAQYFHQRGYSCYWVDHTRNPSLVTYERSTYVLATPSERAAQLGLLPPAAF